MALSSRVPPYQVQGPKFKPQYYQKKKKKKKTTQKKKQPWKPEMLCCGRL
jgi:hypothetical protein